MHESRLHQDNWFVTATYSDTSLPADGSLNREHHTLFMKKLRHHAKAPLRFLMCGEYGEALGRPHYHYIIHGLALPDLKIHGSRQDPHALHISNWLQDIWGHGYCPVAQVTHESAKYVAKYTLKRVTGERAENYIRPHPLTGEPFRVTPEFARMSRRPGLGTGWLERWGETDLSGDFVIVKGQRKPIPKFYVAKLPDKLRAEYAARRKARAMEPQQQEHQTERRLITRHESARLNSLRHTRDKAAGG